MLRGGYFRGEVIGWEWEKVVIWFRIGFMMTFFLVLGFVVSDIN